ncbi:MAG: 6-hydroxycyclohex-1-ene-1-carbonyl-CoA dehydrogenase [Proteobacteria bacterium]|nr:6-hydroxycyclohex-1-ene-1-carbonyl-CoA dehydrogenase [Pseudomonadota bacterium]MBU1742100.1 6-hydroxycyclohex-1-ene-1-carbonyl-CoA dehydrogenase [Pseudomonadota bacterium]
MAIPDKIKTWQMVEGPKYNKEERKIEAPGRLALTEIDVPELGEGEALVEVAGCGVCHTDLSYFYDGVPTVSKPPLTLGHEIAGTVIAGPAYLIGKNVIVPAVMPCNQCDICAQGRGNRCLAQKMPGNSLGMYGGFSSHIPVPAEDLCVIDDLKGRPLEYYAVVADAATTPYQAAMRAELKEGDLALITGVTGGVGVYMGQVAKAFGCKAVVGLGRSEEKLARARDLGVDYTIDTKDKDFKAIQEELKGICKEIGVRHNTGWKIFECTGVGAMQDVALGLLGFIGKLVVVGFGMSKNTYMISRLMAFDADILGSWGCLPKYYPEVLKMVQDGRINIDPLLETRPMSTIKDAFEEAHSGRLVKRIVLTPDF